MHPDAGRAARSDRVELERDAVGVTESDEVAGGADGDPAVLDARGVQMGQPAFEGSQVGDREREVIQTATELGEAARDGVGPMAVESTT